MDQKSEDRELIDLHTHSTASDGTDKPHALMEKAAARNIRTIALTDHDTLAGLGEAGEAAADLGLQFIRGCEISTIADIGEVHILGLWLPEKCEVLENFLEHLRGQRHKRNEAMISRLRAHGFDVTMEEVAAKAKSSVGRPHMAAVLLEKGYVRDRAEAFAKYLGEQGCAFVPKVAPSPLQAVRLLADLGATSVFAHPRLRSWPLPALESLTRNLAKNGLSALEAWHSSHTKEHTKWTIRLAERLGLGLSGGSDYHGLAKPGIQLGENSDLRPWIVERLMERRRLEGLPI